MKRSAGAAPAGPASTTVDWRLTGLPAPRPATRLGRAVGLRVVRLPGTRRVLVVAGTVEWLRDLLNRPAAQQPVRGATVIVVWWRYPRPGWSGTIGPLRHLRRQRVSLPRLRRGAATVRLALTAPVPLREAVRSALRALDGSRPMPAPASAAVTSHREPPSYLPAVATVLDTTDPIPARAEIRSHDLVLGPTTTGPDQPAGTPVQLNQSDQPDGTADQPEQPYGTWLGTTGHTVQGQDGRPLVLVDAERINPRGRLASAYRPGAAEVTLEFARADRPGAGFRGRPGGPTLGGTLTGPGLDGAAVVALRQVGVVHCRLVPGEHPAQTAGLLAQLAATGVLVHAPILAPAVADLLDPELRAIITEPLVGVADSGHDAVPAAEPTGVAPAVTPDPVAMAALAAEARSVRQRRAALRGHAAGLRLAQLGAGGLPVLGRPPSVSAILVTRRPDLVTSALAAVTGQTYPELEIILGLHGIELPESARVALSECGRPFEVVHLPETTDFGAALGAATRRARGTLVTKFDDDDSYGAEHVWDLVLARHYSGATLVGKSAEFVYLENRGVTLRRSSGIPEAYGDVVAGGTMLLAKGDLEAVGGWRPVPRSVDLGLIERLRAEGATIYRTHPLGYLYHRRPAGHTWDPGEAYFVDSSFARWPGVPPELMADFRPPSTAVASDAAGAAARPAGHPPS
ncbi:glycosyltransferase family 2 protein [Solwaraspora sp. WMMD406]|uniref:glycosyltransferase family 2 protein n=1 Tax=Solwaraspora sp. WMMD406 TaxID=3016095 RepID=UPI0024177033|nr:glycosyltransferase family 2 protein [Solwaraspora sp. WMMD406]MDG4763021.1 glycosyltransferase family 2 protein [Solwaraspora sp. WMMD406]